MIEKLYFEEKGEFLTKASIVRFLRKTGRDEKEYYDSHYKKDDEGICPQCGKPSIFHKFSYRKYCSHGCFVLYQKENELSWMLNDPLKKAEAMRKAAETRSKVTVEQENERQRKRMKTVGKNNGMTYAEYMSLVFKRRDAEMTPEEKCEYYKKAHLSKKSYSKYEEYELNGKVVKIQGYEKYVLDALKKVFREGEISVDKHNNLKYEYDDSLKIYFPDIIIGKILIEVKSAYTFKQHLERNLAKLQAAHEQGYTVVLALWDIKQLEMCEKDLIETISSQASMQGGRFNDYPFIGVGNKQMIAEVLGSRKAGDIVCSAPRGVAV